jgi:5,10-methylenetetrahydrofolate reductase
MTVSPTKRAHLLMERLRAPGPFVSVEMRPPKADLEAGVGMSEWIDLHHALGRLARSGRFVFLTDNAVGAEEEESLAHVGANVGDTVDLRHIVPILTTKHSLEYCKMFASRAASDGFETLTVLGGDKAVGRPRCVPHGRDLREIIRSRIPSLALGGWVNPHADPDRQIDFLTAEDAHNDYALAQIVSHHSLPEVERLLEAADRRGVTVPLVFGVFFYRSLNPRTLSILGDFFPVPAKELTREFEAGADAEEILARTVRGLRGVGADKVYVSNLPTRGIAQALDAVLERV